MLIFFFSSFQKDKSKIDNNVKQNENAIVETLKHAKQDKYFT